MATENTLAQRLMTLTNNDADAAKQTLYDTGTLMMAAFKGEEDVRSVEAYERVLDYIALGLAYERSLG